MTFSELHEQKKEEMQEKYADVINDLAVKYGVDMGVAFDHLTAIARANMLHEEALYSTDIEYDLDELVDDYAKLYFYSNQC